MIGVGRYYPVVLPEVRALLAAYFARVGAHQAEALLTLVYWTVVGPTAVLLKVIGRDYLNVRATPGSHWHARPAFPRDPESLSRPY